MRRAWKVDAIGVAAVLGITGIGYLAGVGPMVRDRVAEVEEAASIQLAQGELESVDRDLARAQALVNGLKNKVERRGVRLQPVSAQHERNRELAQLARELGVEITQITPGEPRSQGAVPGLVIVPMKISGVGGYPQSTRFLARLHAVFPDMAIASLSLEHVPGKDAGASSFSVDLRWHAEQVATSAASGETP